MSEIERLKFERDVARMSATRIKEELYAQLQRTEFLADAFREQRDAAWETLAKTEKERDELRAALAKAERERDEALAALAAAEQEREHHWAAFCVASEERAAHGSDLVAAVDRMREMREKIAIAERERDDALERIAKLERVAFPCIVCARPIVDDVHDDCRIFSDEVERSCEGGELRITHKVTLPGKFEGVAVVVGEQHDELRAALAQAIRERDEARAEVESLRGELARLRAWATGERGEPSL